MEGLRVRFEAKKWSILLTFFVMSFIGWLWEVSLHLVTDGRFVNRGVLYGPWLPIYGVGSVLVLRATERFRKKLWQTFGIAIFLCGLLEYMTSWGLEQLYHGTRWWDYSDYFLNLHGRICIKGLLFFGAGSMVIVYMLGPLLDRAFQRIPQRALVITVLALLLMFIMDVLYSMWYPNTGMGITSTSLCKNVENLIWLCDTLR